MTLADIVNAPWATYVATGAAIAGAGAATIANLQMRRQTREQDRERRWWNERAKLELIGVADHADSYALRGIEQPGTQAVRTMYPGFDFTMGGKYNDTRPLRNTDNVWYSPWPQSVVESLAEYQESGTLQPYVCGTDYAHGKLVPHPKEWRCPVCSYTQRWVLRYVADGSWRTDRDLLRGGFAKLELAAPPSRPSWVGFARRRLGLFLSTAPKSKEDKR